MRFFIARRWGFDFGGESIEFCAALAKRLRKAGKGVEETMAEIKSPWYKGHGPLHMAASAGKIAVCKLLIKDLKLGINAASDDGNCSYFPFFFSCCLAGSLCCDLWGKKFCSC